MRNVPETPAVPLTYVRELQLQQAYNIVSVYTD